MAWICGEARSQIRVGTIPGSHGVVWGLNDAVYSWIPKLGETFLEHRFEVLDEQRFGPTLLACKPATENWLMALEEAGSVIIKRGGEAGSQMSFSDYMALLSKAEVETREGVSLWIDIVVVVGRG